MNTVTIDHLKFDNAAPQGVQMYYELTHKGTMTTEHFERAFPEQYAEFTAWVEDQTQPPAPVTEHTSASTSKNAYAEYETRMAKHEQDMADIKAFEAQFYGRKR